MTPLYLNSPPSSFQFGEQKDDQHLQLFLSSSHRSPSSLSCPTFFNKTQDQRMIKIEDDGKVGECIAGGGSSSDHVHVVSSSSSLQPVMDHVTNGYNQSLCKREVGEGNTSTDNGSAKWMSSKMRLMQKMMNANCTGTDESVKITRKFQYQMHEINSFSNSNTSSTFRICADCNTTTTPLWRSGPRGPKSLCNACGIRQRKARRAMEAAAANGTIAAATDTKIKVQINKEKKSRTSHVAQYKKQSNNKTPDPPLPPPHHHHQIQTQRKPCFKEFALNLSKNSAIKQVLPQDVEEAAILLMELSCGFIQS